MTAKTTTKKAPAAKAKAAEPKKTYVSDDTPTADIRDEEAQRDWAHIDVLAKRLSEALKPKKGKDGPTVELEHAANKYLQTRG